ncbi:MAG: CHAT domain-containing protein [Cytophagales bacterium]|nr:CHAT domain-containing protein [Cytophagales bacterium]
MHRKKKSNRRLQIFYVLLFSILLCSQSADFRSYSPENWTQLGEKLKKREWKQAAELLRKIDPSGLGERQRENFYASLLNVHLLEYLPLDFFRSHYARHLKSLQTSETDSLVYSEFYFIYSKLEFEKGHLDSAYRMSKKCLSYLPRNSSELVRLQYYNLIAAIYTKKKEYFSAYTFARQSSAIAKKRAFSDRAVYALKYNEASLCQYIGENERSYVILKEILQKKDLFPPYCDQGVSHFHIYHSLANYFKTSRKFGKALEWLERAEAIVSRQPRPENSAAYCLLLLKKGQIREAMEHLPKAVLLYQEAASIAASKPEELLAYRFEASLNQASLLVRQGRLKNAKELLHRLLAIREFGQFSETSLYYPHRIRWQLVMAQLEWKENKLKLEEAGVRNRLLNNEFELIRMIELFRLTASSLWDQEPIMGYFKDFYEQSLERLSTLYTYSPHSPQIIDASFRLLEQQHAFQRKSKSHRKENLPSFYWKSYQKLQYFRSRLLLDNSIPVQQKTAQLDSIQGAIRLLEEQFKLRLQKPEGVRLNHFCASLKQEQSAYVSYYLGKKHLYLLVITPESQQLLRRTRNEEMQRGISQMIWALYEDETRSLGFSGKKAAQKLYQELIDPVVPQISNYPNLLVTPHNELSYIPFDLLQSKSNRFLIEDYSVYYTYSVDLWEQAYQKEKRRESAPEAKRRVLAMAPFNLQKKTAASAYRLPKETEDWPKLPYSHQEVAEVHDHPMLGDTASKKEFIKNALKHEVIHLATHAVTSTQSPELSYIQFYPQGGSGETRLYYHEIMQMNLRHVLLVALSACQTGYGKIVQGEGIVSISNAFQQAGASNVLFTYWYADDQSTSDLIVSFYRYLKKGESKTEALRKAKLKFMKQSSHRKNRNPYYWANVQLAGNALPMYYPSNETSAVTFWQWTGIVFILCVLFFFCRKKARAEKY